jgi:hypothetical protein
MVGDTVMSHAATSDGIPPRSIRFKAALQFLEAFQALIVYQSHLGANHRAEVYQKVLRAIAVHRVADRSDRFEPRLTKRRLKRYDRPTKPKQELKRQMFERVSKI